MTEIIIETATWLSLIALGPGAALIFVWFLLDLRRILHGRNEEQ